MTTKGVDLTKYDYSLMSEERIAQMEAITSNPGGQLLVETGLLPTPPAGAVVLDNACGAGVIAQLLFGEGGIPAGGDVKLVCGDLEAVMVNTCKDRVAKNGWNAEVMIIDAQAIPLPDNHFTHALINFGLQVMPNRPLALKESLRVLRPGGIFGFTAWSAPGWLDDMLAGCPGFVTPPLFTTDAIVKEDSVTALLTAAGFVPESITFRPFEAVQREKMDEFLALQAHIMKDVLEGENGKAFEKYMREKYGDGEFEMAWKGVLVTAKKPAA